MQEHLEPDILVLICRLSEQSDGNANRLRAVEHLQFCSDALVVVGTDPTPRFVVLIAVIVLLPAQPRAAPRVSLDPFSCPSCSSFAWPRPQSKSYRYHNADS